MHISNLPNELLVNIIGRLDFDSVGSIQFLNKKFHNLVNVHRLYKPLADPIRISVVTSRGRKAFCDISVNAWLPRRCYFGKKKQGNIRRKIDKLRLNEIDQQQIRERLVDMLKKFQIGLVKELYIDHRSLSFDISNAMEDGGVGMDVLQKIHTDGYIETRCITKEHFDKLVNGTVNNFWFGKCNTGISFHHIINYIKQNLEDNLSFRIWNFGVFTMTVDEVHQVEKIVEGVKPKTIVHYRRTRNKENPRIMDHILFNEEKSSCIMWQETIDL